MQGEAWKDKIDAGKTQRMWVLVSGTKNTVVWLFAVLACEESPILRMSGDQGG